MLSEDFEEKVNLLNSTLRDSIEKLLEKASKENAVLPPFGRPPTPTPFVEDDEEVCQDATEDDDTRNDAADFKYEYGFNPLTFLAEFIHRAHPDSIALRNQQKADARARLRHRAGHARNHLETAAGLSQRALQLRSGIIHGPLTSPCSPTSVTFFCRPVAVGEVVVQLSLDRNFVEATTTRLSSNGPSDPLKAVLNDLQPASKYFCRCHLELPGEVDQTGVEVSYASCQFWTLLDIPSSNTDNEVPHQEVEVVAINGHYRQLRKDCGTSCMSISDDESVRPMFSVVLGDIFDATSSQSTDAQLWQLFRQDPIFAAFCNEKDRNSMLTMSSMLCAWNDSQKGSDTGLKAEEIVHKQWSYDTRKYEKRQKEKLEKEKKEAFEQKAGGPSPSRKRSVAPPPALNRPAMSLAFSKLAKEFPLQYSEDNVRHLYRSFPLSQDAEAFVLDSRNGYLGKDQVRWLKDSIRKSSAAIKIIFSGKTFGYHLVDHLTSAVQDQVTDDTEIDAAGDNINSDLQDGVVEGKEELTVTLSDRQENATDSTTPLGDSTVVSPSSAAQQGKQNNVKKVSSSRQRALEATKEEFDDDGLSKSSLAHVVVSTHRKLYPLTEKHEDYSNEEGEDIDLEEEDTGTRLDSKLVLSGGILIVSSADTEESFAATYNFGRTSDEVQAEDFFCLEVGLGRAGNGGEPQVCEEKPALTAEEVLVCKGRKVLYRSSSDLDVMDDNVNSMSCSIVVKENGVLNVAMKRVDSGVIAFEKCVSSALFTME